MSLFIASLNSGSNGNCYYIGDGTDAVLIDAGISCRETEKRMLRLGLEIGQVRAVFITHEHSDHIRGVEALSKKHNIPVYITEATLKQSRLGLNRELVRNFAAHEQIIAGTLEILPFPKLHDAIDPHSFLVRGMGLTIGILTDIGQPCEHVIKYFSECDAVFLEANYDEDMLDKGHYPAYLKNRIRSEKGHLSNAQALELLSSAGSPELSHVFLSHLSKDNNSPQIALDAFEKYTGKACITIASRYNETPVYKVRRGLTEEMGCEIKQEAEQMSLF